MEKRNMSRGEIVQIDPHNVKEPVFAGCLAFVESADEDGATLYIQGWGVDGALGPLAWYDATWEEMVETGGMAPYTAQFNDEDDDGPQSESGG